MRSIVHLDADAFFAAVEQASDSRLRGKPVAVGGEKRGIIASASYEARKFGIFTPMPTVRARRLCPQLILLPGDFEKYERFSQWMFSYAYDFTPDVEIASIDEGYFDLSGVRKPALEVAGTIREAIRQALKISVSEGVGSNKLVSQVASKLNKPAAFQMVPPGGETAFLHPLPNRWLPGVGPKTGSRLDAAGLVRIQQVAETSADLLSLLVGNAAPQLKRFANGIDERPVLPVSEPAKSFSHQETFETDQTDEEFILATLRRMADSLMTQVREEGKSIRTLTVKVRYNDMDEDQCSESLEEPTDLETDLYGRIAVMLRQAWKRRVSLRLVSLKLSNVYEAFNGGTLPLERSDQQQAARRQLARMLDDLRKQHGRGIILRGHDLILRDHQTAPAAAPAPVKVKLSVREVCKYPVPGRGIRPVARGSVLVSPLGVRSYYTFLDSTLSPSAILALAAKYQVGTVALTDTGNLHGAVEFTQLAKEAGIKPVLGAGVVCQGKPLQLYVQNTVGYQNLCRLLTLGVTPARLEEYGAGLIAVGRDAEWSHLFPERFYLGATDAEEMSRWPASRRLPVVAWSDVRYATAQDRWKYNIVQSIRTCTLLQQAHAEKQLEGAFHFASPTELAQRFRGDTGPLERVQELLDRCEGKVPLGQPQFPQYQPYDGSSPHDFLRRLVLEGARRRYPAARIASVRPQLEEELSMIAEVRYEEYFLVVWELLQECRRQGISWITRGSAADSLVCYCLGISDVCPIRFDLYFRRFLNKERMAMNKLPDIDIDFPHDRKDDVIDLIFAKYGSEHAAVVGGFSTFQARGAVGEVGKVLGISEYQIRRFTQHFPWSGAHGLVELLRQIPECRDLPLDEEPYRSALHMAEFLDGFPRYAKMHPCGVVVSREPMNHLTPCFQSSKGYPTTHMDMDAVEAVGLIKMDILAQGGLAAMRDVQESLARRGITIEYETLTATRKDGNTAGLPPRICPPAPEPWMDPAVWEMIADGGGRAVHHIESPAMVSLCRQCNVHDIDGLVAIVSVIRPGAANEQKKLRFTRRYQGLEPVTYPHPSLESSLRSTFGLVVYEEHILQICEAFAGLPGGRADVLRRALGKEKHEVIAEMQKEFFVSARRRGHDEAKIAEVWDLVRGFSGYAFCKAHSTAYGVEAYQSAWLKRYFPAEFMAAVLSNGKGFYQPLVYVLECYRLGIPLLPPWVNDPGPAFHPVPAHTGGRTAIRVPIRVIQNITEATQKRMVEERQRGPFASLGDFYRRVCPTAEEMEILLKVGAFDGFDGRRPALFWEIQTLVQRWGRNGNSKQGWLLPAMDETRLPQVRLEEPTRLQRLQWEMENIGFTVSGHPLDLYPDIAWKTYCPVARLGEFIGQTVTLCGLIVEDRVHHQVTGEAMKFLTLADWSGMVETELFAPTYKTYGLMTVRYPVLEISAIVEPYENGRGHTLRVLRAGKPRTREKGGPRAGCQRGVWQPGIP